ncbi:MAG TPA: ribonuclease III [Nitrospiria bacterium]|jgi:ribonuclease-3|nr:ribonuclease III [Nitrospiria bacterium]
MSLEPLDTFQKILGYSFRKPDHLRAALTHKSYLNELRASEKEGATQDNERLEFLGDAVLDLAISERLISLYPLSTEGDLSKMKARLVSEVTLARVAGGLGVGEFLLLGRGEERTRGREKPSILADALEAVIAAVYLDGGFETARAVLIQIFEEEFRRLDQGREDIDYKTELQECCQREFDVLPTYRVLRESGPDHQKLFEVKLMIKEEVFGIGRGRSKKEAEQQAAKQALEKLTRRPL